MRLGRLDTRIEIVREGETGRDEFNTPITGLWVVVTMMAERMQQSGREYLAADGVQARTAQTVDRRARHLDGQPGQQRGHAGDVAVVFAGLVGAAQDRIVQLFPTHAGIAGYQGLDGHGGKIIRPHGRQGAAVAAEGSADRIADIGMHGHESL